MSRTRCSLRGMEQRVVVWMLHLAGTRVGRFRSSSFHSAFVVRGRVVVVRGSGSCRAGAGMRERR